MTTAKTSNPTTVPGISKPPADVSPALRKYLESLSEAIEIRLGRRGDPRDRAITLRELIDSGLATELAGRPFNPNGGGGPTFQPPYDGTVPPTPTGFTANGGYAIVTLFWDYPKYGPHAHTEIWRNSANVIGDAQLVGISSGLSFVDPVGEGASFYYWIRHVSTSGVYSQFNSADGTLAQTALNVTLLLQTLNGAITESQLTQALGSRINLIDADVNTINSVAYRVQQEALARAQAVTDEADARAAAIFSEATNRQNAIDSAVEVLQAQINDLSAIAEYDNATSYVTGELVTYNGFLYRAKSATTGNLPTNTTYWELLGEYSSLADIVDQNAASIVQINTIDATSTSAAAQAIVGIKAEVFNPNGTARLATATALSALTSDVRVIYDGPNSSLLKTAQQDITALETEVFNPNGTARLATVTSVDALTDSVEAIYDGDNPSLIKTIQTDITSLETEVFNGDGTSRLATASAVSALTQSVEAIYNGNNPSVVKTIQTDVSLLEGAVFDVNGVVKLATGESLEALTNEVHVIYDGTNPSLVKTIQEDITSLEGAVFNIDGSVKLATGDALTSLTNEVRVIYKADGSPSLIKSIQTDVTALEGAVFNVDGTVKLATGDALTALTNEVRVIYKADGSPSLVKSIQEDITSLEGAVFNPDGTVKLATAAAVSLLQTEVWGDGVTPGGATASRIDTLSTTLTDPVNGLQAVADALSTVKTEVFPNGVSSASAIDTLNSQVFDASGNLRLATASALSTLNTQINGAGAIASKVDAFAAELYINGVVGGTPRLATATALSQISSEVFPNGTASASSITQLSSRLNNAGGSGVSLESAFSTQAGINTGLSAQYTVKIDNNNYVTGFGLASTPRDGTPFSEFTVRADRFAIASPSLPGNQNIITPFVVTTTTQEINGVTVPPGVYISDAVIANGTITSAKIGLAEIDHTNIGSVNADTITVSTLSATRIALDNTVLDTYFDAATGKDRLYIPNARIDNAHIKDLAVNTLKIAGNSITIPLSFSAGDVYVNQVINLGSGGTTCDPVYVGPNQGEYVFSYIDPSTEEEVYDYVGFPNGDFNYVCTTTDPTFTSSMTVLETPWITVGDVTDGGSIIVFYATMDAGTTQDAGQHIYMLVDKNNGNGYQIVANTVAGTRTASGDTYASIPMAISTTVTGLSMMKVKILTGTRRVDLPPGTFSSPSTLRNISLSILGARR